MTGFQIGEVDEENLVEASLAKGLRREALDLVGGGHNEHVTPAILHPG